MTQNVPQFIYFKKCSSGSWIPVFCVSAYIVRLKTNKYSGNIYPTYKAASSAQKL